MNLIDEIAKYCNYKQSDVISWKKTVADYLNENNKNDACHFIFQNLYQPCPKQKQNSYSTKINEINSYKFNSNYLYLFIKDKKKYIFLSNAKNTHIIAYLNLCSVLENDLIKNKKEEESKVKKALSNEKKISISDLNSINFINYVFTIKASSSSREFKETFFWNISKNPSGTCTGCDSSFKEVSCNPYKSYTSCFIAFRNSIQNYELIKHTNFNSIYIVKAKYRPLNEDQINKKLLFSNLFTSLGSSENYTIFKKDINLYFSKNKNNLLKVGSIYLLKKDFMYLGNIKINDKLDYLVAVFLNNKIYYILTDNISNYYIKKSYLINSFSYNFKIKNEDELNSFISKISNFVTVNNNYFYKVNLKSDSIVFNNKIITLNNIDVEDLSDNANKVNLYWFELYGKIFVVDSNWLNNLKRVNLI